MLEHLKLIDVGPAPAMEIDFAPRLDFLTGDNGLGKTFLLDIAWWAWREHLLASEFLGTEPARGSSSSSTRSRRTSIPSGNGASSRPCSG